MLEIRPMTLPDLTSVLDWAAQEGWNPGLDDAVAFLAADPAGFLLGRVDGQPAAAISVVNHSDRFAFLGLYICAPHYRGQGHGLAVWKAGLAHGAGRTIGLDGVPDQEANYAASGFVRAGGTTRFSGTPGHGTGSAEEITQPDVPDLLALDRRHSGVTRPRFMTPWFAGAPDRRSFIVRRAGQITGYVTARRCRQGCKLGPFSAQDRDTAGILMRTAAQWAGQTPVVIDVPDSAPEMAEMLRAQGFEAAFATARMYHGAPLKAAPPPFYAVATLELG